MAQAEIAWVEESAERGIGAFEFKWRSGARAKCPEAFARAYPEAAWTCVTRENYDAFSPLGAEAAMPDLDLRPHGFDRPLYPFSAYHAYVSR